ncbi:hypothetical protein B0J11DRAFT_186065 [Dendryphion nanum]|uniref:BZIP domain-containing protein n=1 Tax=Dendryphion nanum TaxID=256645 RepID=A0A9P9D4Z0_9PLEO|nr:hypothetical protein B0J11DRAFT_186065 [Dendryphion nanum]
MKHAVIQLSWPQGEAKQNSDRPADAEKEANKQRRKVQNRKNQRAHRLRLLDNGVGTVQRSHPFKVRRWRLDEPDDCSLQESSPASESAATTHISQPPSTYSGISSSTVERTVVFRGSPPTAHIHPSIPLDPQPFTFPLSSDHLLHLIQYNVFRALVSNKRALNTVPSDLAICPATGPYRDDTILNPLNHSTPPSLLPTTLQQVRYHSIWINAIPFPRVRDNLIKYDSYYDPRELMQDLIGDFVGFMPTSWRRGRSILAPVLETKRSLILSSGSDTDEITAGRNGLIVWGEPHEIQSWEITPGFLAKWTWAMEGCEELIEISNYWRTKRGEEPMRLLVSSSYPPTLLSRTQR